jgi:hypothetical protein
MKNKALRFLSVIYFFALAVPRVYAQLDGGLVNKTIEARLLQGGLLNAVQFENADPELAPDNTALRYIFEESGAALKPFMLVESLYLCKKPARFNTASWNTDEKTAVLNVLVSISTLTGIQYYSRSRGAMRTFYEKSYVIKSPREKTPESDPVFSAGELPSNFTLYSRQKDLSFGDNVYRYDYFVGDDAIIFTQTNYSAVSYGVIPLAAKEKLRVIAAVIDAGEYFLIYAASMAKEPPFSALKKKAGGSFASRAEALINWFTRRIGAAAPR